MNLDWRAVMSGASWALVIAVPAGMVQRVVGDGAGVAPVLFAVILAAAGLGGYMAARPQPARGLTAGGFAAGLAYGIIAMVNVGAAIVRGQTRSPLGYVAGFLLFTSVGIVGGYVAFRRSLQAGVTDPDADTAIGEEP